jgi:hypothetical protein
MSSCRSAAVLVAALLALTACGSSNDSDTTAGGATADGDAVAVGAAPTAPSGAGNLGDAVKVAAGAVDDATAAVCPIDRQTLETAVDAYELLNGELPTSQQELLDAQLILEVSVRYDITAEGAVVPAVGSPCT